MCEKLEFNEKYKAFTEVLHRKVQTFEQCEEDVVQALAIVADDLKLGKVKYELDAPVSKIRPHGEHRVGKLFDNQGGIWKSKASGICTAGWRNNDVFRLSV